MQYARSVPSEKREGVQSLSRALDLLEALAASDERALSELAEETGMIPSTAHRLLASLVQRGYVARSTGNGRYRIGSQLLAVASSAASRRDALVRAARPHLEELSAQTGESVNLVLLDGLDVVYLAQAEGRHAVRMASQVGRAVPAHATAAGKAILATHPADAVLRDVERAGALIPRTPHTITDAAALGRALDRVRRDGFAIDEEERELGVGCIAAAIPAADGAAEAAISVSGPCGRVVTDAAAELGREVARHALAVSVALAAEREPTAA